MRLFAAIVRSGPLLCGIACLLASSAFVPMAQAGAKRKPSVLVVHSSPFSIADVQAKLNSSGQFAAVDLFNGGYGTPTLAALKAYDAVLVTSDNNFSDPVALGNTLADYVDAGGGVVNAAYSVGSLSPPAGRWNPGYLCMVPGANLANTGASLDLDSIFDPNHATLIGVNTLSTQFGYRINQNSVIAGANLVARWTGGNVLVATGPLPGRADLNLGLASGDVTFGGWNPATDDGVKIMVNTLLFVMRPKVLLVHADFDISAADVQAKLRATGTLGQVDRFDANAGTPTLAQLQAYDAVLTWNNRAYNNPEALGNVLADYVDAGGGVVTAAFCNADAFMNSPSGRWISGGYEIIPARSSFASGTATLGAVAYSSHPIMRGVTSFNGGSLSGRPFTLAINPGGLIVAKWSDGRTLAAVSTKMPNRAELGFYPPSNSVSASYWQVGTNGDKLMANALLYTVKPYVAIASAETNALSSDIYGKLFACRRFSGVENINTTASVPALVTLSPFSAVLTWSDNNHANPAALGNTLADYVDAGGGVVSAIFGITSSSSPQGRWVSQGYEIVPSPLPSFLTSGPQFLGPIAEPAHPIASFVRKFDGKTNSFRLSSTPLLRGRTIIKWTDGKMLASAHNSKKRADLGFWPPSDLDGNNGWNQRTDGTWMMANALEFVVRAKPCPGDLNGDGVVDDSDFVLFVAYYNTLVDPRGDLTGDGNTEDADFVAFVGAYNTLTCP
jgi:hypothetical protein